MNVITAIRHYVNPFATEQRELDRTMRQTVLELSTYRHYAILLEMLCECKGVEDDTLKLAKSAASGLALRHLARVEARWKAGTSGRS